MFIIALTASLLNAATPAWVDVVGPLLTPAEKKQYLAATPMEREKIEAGFWADKTLGEEQYFHRVAQVDAKFGSDKRGSGANTDQGRVWLALGPPRSVKRLPSSRIFVPLEIWYYDTVPGVLNSEIRLVFYQKNSIGFPTLYAPGLDTIRNLLLPQSATRSMFGPNASITESDIRKVLRTGPAEDEVITAAVNVASGIKYSGNQEILAQVTSPRHMLVRDAVTRVHSRFIAMRAPLNVLETIGPYGYPQVDLRLDASARSTIEVELLSDLASIYRNKLDLQFETTRPVTYLHRLDLLPGAYRLVVTIDGVPNGYPLTVTGHANTREILRVNPVGDRSRGPAPFEFDGRQYEQALAGRFALVPLARPGKVAWTIRRGSEVVWRANSEGATVGMVELPAELPSAAYRLEAASGDGDAVMDLRFERSADEAEGATVLSYNANLSPDRRMAFIGRQWLLRGRYEEARRCLKNINTEDAQIDLARLDALDNKLDSARNRVRGILSVHPDNFEALSVFAYIETRFQDYATAADLYRRALALQDSPSLRAALASLPSR